MKKIKCYDCNKEFQAQMSKDMLNDMYTHYMEVHKEIITGADEAEKKSWMERFNKDWESA